MYCKKKNAFVALKDHKQNFRSATQCRLINPCKSELGKISKIILENINKTLIKKLNANQWRKKQRNGYALVQIYRTKIKMLLYLV